MKVLMDPIETIVRFKGGIPTPVRFRHKDQVVNIDRIIGIRDEKLVGNPVKVYQCQSEVYGRVVRYELRFELHTCKWFLYKM
ncbi:Hypothetical protein DPCES_2268 [Desulfitobacterium hafniense]|uniref:Uncharacterized protein n=1 Tax=Desulfitobacterium hafniense TaxID=49338 RepID=A0A098B1D6_DESHA|nr:Hypothetical protein DPCES_2268 [Desulfitobacterium hafniense]